MSRIARPIPTAPRRLNWKLALPAIGLAACAALYAHAGAASAASADEHTAASHFSISHGEPENAYALVRETTHGTNMSGDSANWSDVDLARRSIKGEFLWFRNGGKAYVVQDAGVLAKARAAWAPVDRMGQQMDAYGQQMDQHGKKMEALGKEMAQAPRGAMDEVGRRMREAGQPMDALGKQMAALGRQMEQESHKADRAVRELIRDAMARGLARPVLANG